MRTATFIVISFIAGVAAGAIGFSRSRPPSTPRFAFLAHPSTDTFGVYRCDLYNGSVVIVGNTGGNTIARVLDSGIDPNIGR